MRNDPKKEGKHGPFRLDFLVPYFGRHKALLFWMIFTGLLASVPDSVFPLFQRYAINHFIARNTLDTMGVFLTLYIVLLILRACVSAVSTYLTNRLEVELNYDMRSQLFDHLQDLSLGFYNRNGVGYIHSRLLSDIGRIGALASWMLMTVVWEGGYMIMIMVIMAFVNWQLFLILLALIPIEAAAAFYFQRRLTKANRRVREINSRITSDYNEGITGVETIRTMVIQKHMDSGFQKDTSDMYREGIRVGRFRGLLRGVILMTGYVGLALVLWRGGILNMQGLLSIGTLSVFTSYAIILSGCVMSMVDVLDNLINCRVNIERVDKMLREQPDVSDTPEVIEKYGTSLEPKTENWEPLHGEIEFRDVSFRYPDGEEMILEHFNLKVPEGTSVAIVGHTGAGKSTLVNLAGRFFEPTEGQLLIDGRDARERSQLWLHANIGYVLQTPHLFSGTVLENLRYGRPDASMEEIEAACRLVCADRVIAHMDKGYDSQVGEGGSLLSTGEKQLISFARAILADPRILVLDEATSSIDTLTEQLIQNAIGTMTKGRTSFMIAHRLSTIRGADLILLVEDGKIIERGTHRELMDRKGAYYSLYMQQFSEEGTAETLAREHVHSRRPADA